MNKNGEENVELVAPCFIKFKCCSKFFIFCNILSEICFFIYNMIRKSIFPIKYFYII